jgi:hypothetical protein
MIYRLSLTWPQLQKSEKCSTAAFPKLFMFREVGMWVSLVTMSHHLPKNWCFMNPCLPLDIKDSVREDSGFSGGGFFHGGMD